jgi:hypothetical protein
LAWAYARSNVTVWLGGNSEFGDFSYARFWALYVSGCGGGTPPAQIDVDASGQSAETVKASGIEVSDATQDVRFAVAMSGGVSLAVWMGGIAREINLLQQASNFRVNESHNNSGRGQALGALRQLCAITAGRDVTTGRSSDLANLLSSEEGCHAHAAG